MVLGSHQLHLRVLTRLLGGMPHIHDDLFFRCRGDAKRLPRVQASEASAHVIGGDAAVNLHGILQLLILEYGLRRLQLQLQQLLVGMILPADLILRIDLGPQRVYGPLSHLRPQHSMKVVHIESHDLIHQFVIIIEINFRNRHVPRCQRSGKAKLQLVCGYGYGQLDHIVFSALRIRLLLQGDILQIDPLAALIPICRFYIAVIGFSGNQGLCIEGDGIHLVGLIKFIQKPVFGVEPGAHRVVSAVVPAALQIVGCRVMIHGSPRAARFRVKRAVLHAAEHGSIDDMCALLPLFPHVDQIILGHHRRIGILGPGCRRQGRPAFPEVVHSRHIDRVLREIL